METIFKSAVNHIRVKENTKRKTEEYLVENMTSISSASAPGRIKRILMKRVIVVACTAVFVCAASIGAYAYYKTPTSYLSLDINPSVELGVNALGNVVSATAYNDDGKTILDGQNVFGSDVKSAVNTLVKSAAQKGFVAEDGSTVIAVTSETDNSTTATDLQEAAEQGADSAVKSQGDTVSVEKENVALERRDEARKLGITPGKLNLIQKLQALDPSITVDEYKDAKVTNIMKKFVELKKATLKNQDNSENSASSSVNESSEVSSQASSSESGEATATQPQPQPNSSKAKSNASGKLGKNSSASSTESSQSSSSTVTSTNTNSNNNSISGKSSKPVNSNANHGQNNASSHKK